jgi:hypothetical protein
MERAGASGIRGRVRPLCGISGNRPRRAVISEEMANPSRAGVAKWQTRRTQNPLPERACGFKSLLRYSILAAEKAVAVRATNSQPTDDPDRPTLSQVRCIALLCGFALTYGLQLKHSPQRRRVCQSACLQGRKHSV